MCACRPGPVELFWAIWSNGTRSLRAVAREYGVRGSTVRQWCIEDGVPYPTHDEREAITALERQASKRYARESIRNGARTGLGELLDRLWADHGCGEFLARYGEGSAGATAVG